ncbi:cytidine deaminase [Flexibacter flexilis DSM 6793]|uniref:Cytidine deaminase n=1 Tax=Flexibacter flexilis DSM 6793 TaxID=927664 RepID=A0A1I1L4P9_9BACT|nr:cytidine deaminase [Flexibacter flexilis]SFC68057.1 cytidine deaminase [Flexibacter flexilis DSM 6793]
MSEKKELKIAIDVYANEAELPEHLRVLWHNATAATNNAYAPYSNFHVGAALLLSDGSILQGNNQENAAYPSGLCAERTALFYASANYGQHQVKAIAVAARPSLKPTHFLPIVPCGGCRQVMREYEYKQKQNIQILLPTDGGKFYVFDSVAALLPLSFDASQLA